MRLPGHLAVVVPAHNEESLIGACLRSLRLATHALRCAYPDLTAQVVVVDDASTDRTAQLAAAGGAVVTSTAYLNVGRARARGVTAALALAAGRGLSPDRVWLCHTDADTVVPPQWLHEQAALASAGAQVVVGTVQPAAADASLGAWWDRHELVEGHPHVHGANLGIDADTYLALGGFAAMSAHEDVDLVARARRGGYAVLATDRIRVTTSSRMVGRTKGGFADYLAGLEQEAIA